MEALAAGFGLFDFVDHFGAGHYLTDTAAQPQPLDVSDLKFRSRCWCH